MLYWPLLPPHFGIKTTNMCHDTIGSGMFEFMAPYKFPTLSWSKTSALTMDIAREYDMASISRV